MRGGAGGSEMQESGVGRVRGECVWGWGWRIRAAGEECGVGRVRE